MTKKVFMLRETKPVLSFILIIITLVALAYGTAWAGLSFDPVGHPEPSSPMKLQVIQPSGHILISTPNGYIKVYNAKKVADGIGIDAEEGGALGIHLCGNEVRFGLNADKTRLVALCSSISSGGYSNDKDDMAKNNLSISLIDISNLSKSTIIKTVHSGDFSGLLFKNLYEVSVSPNGKIVLAADKHGRLHQFDLNLKYIQTIDINDSRSPSNIAWSSDGYTAYLPLTGGTETVVKIKFGVSTNAPGLNVSRQPKVAFVEENAPLTVRNVAIYTIEKMNATNETTMLALQKLGIMDILGAIGLLSGSVTPITPDKIWDNKMIYEGDKQPYPNGPQPMDIKSHPTQKQFYIPNFKQGTVSVVDVSYKNHIPELSLHQNIAVGCGTPSRVAFIDDGSYAFVACNYNISTIDAQKGLYLKRSAAALVGPMSMEWVQQ